MLVTGPFPCNPLYNLLEKLLLVLITICIESKHGYIQGGVGVSVTGKIQQDIR